VSEGGWVGTWVGGGVLGCVRTGVGTSAPLLWAELFEECLRLATQKKPRCILPSVTHLCIHRLGSLLLVARSQFIKKSIGTAGCLKTQDPEGLGHVRIDEADEPREAAPLPLPRTDDERGRVTAGE